MPENKFTSREAMARCRPMSQLEGITQSTLTKQLRELEAAGFLCRTVYPEVPPRVEYTLTPMGESFAPILEEMLAWSEAHLCPEASGQQSDSQPQQGPHEDL